MRNNVSKTTRKTTQFIKKIVISLLGNPVNVFFASILKNEMPRAFEYQGKDFGPEVNPNDSYYKTECDYYRIDGISSRHIFSTTLIFKIIYV